MSLEAVREDFDRIARLVAKEPERPERYESFLLEHVPERGAVLEIGCGAGRLARTIAKRGATVTAIDASPEMIRLARLRAGEVRIELVCCAFSEFRAAPGAYDGIVSVTTLHHLPVAPALARMKELLKPGGVLVIHDVRSKAGIGERLRCGWAAGLNGDALWWVGQQLRQPRALRQAWRDHGAGERYLTMAGVRALYDVELPGARVWQHPLSRYTVVWRSP